MASRIVFASLLAAFLFACLVSCQEESNEIIPESSSQEPPVVPTTSRVEATTKRAETEPTGGTIFSRLMHDIFQIPIQVLKAVRQLLTNPTIGERHNARLAARRNATQQPQ